MFPSHTYIERRYRLKKQVKSGVALILGNDESPMNYPDNTFHFRQDSSFVYLFGLDHPGLIGIVDIDENKDIVFGNNPSLDDIVWMGTQPTLEERAQRVGIEDVRPLDQLQSYLTTALSKQRRIHYLPPYRSKNILKIFDLLGITPSEMQNRVSIELVRAIVDQRAVKTDEEIAEIEKAVNISVAMHLAAMQMVKPGLTEAHIAARVYEVALAANAQISFPIIATIRGETLHNHYHGNTLKSGDLFLLDAGAETELRYAGDLSSTMPVDKKFTERQKDIYQVTLDAHEAAISALKPGVEFMQVHLTACKTIARGMKSLGLMKGDVDEAVAAGAHAIFFPCGTGHMMGLDVHDMEDLGETYVGYEGRPKSTQFGLKSLRLARPLQPGFVVTIEPGIYFIPALIDRWKSERKLMEFLNYDKIETYKNFGGIRNEEDFVITRDGYRLLGRPLPKTIEAVEAARK